MPRAALRPLARRSCRTLEVKLEMAKRAQFWQVARGVLTSFASRNNDVCGYWGIGVLARTIQERGLARIDLPLHPVPLHSTEPVLSALAARYSDLLAEKLFKAGVPVSWLAGAKLVFCFPVAASTQHHLGASAPGEPFECRLEVTDERQCSKVFTWAGWCWPQGGGPESRSTRTHDL